MDTVLPTFREQFYLFLHNSIFLACVFSWFGAQFLKTAIKLVYGKVHSFGDLLELMIWRTGGMPSSHSAIVSSLCTTIGFKNGIHSDIFLLSFVFFLVVIRDAFGVRRSSGMQAHKLNEIGKELEIKSMISKFSALKEVDGHTPMEVICGCLLGFFVGLAFSLLK